MGFWNKIVNLFAKKEILVEANVTESGKHEVIDTIVESIEPEINYQLIQKEDKYIFNPDYFDNFYSKLRDHQAEAIESLDGKNIGQICIPTGTGKTYIQTCLHVKSMINKTYKNQTGVYVIAAHRLLLCQQLLGSMLKVVYNSGIRADIIFVGSQKFNFDKLRKQFSNVGFHTVVDADGNSTTSSKKVKSFVDKAKINNHHVIIASTYHSFNRLANLEEIEICTFDEAHVTTQDDFTSNINEVKPIIRNQYFFTATQRVFGDTGGQNDVEFYGNTEYIMTTRQAIEAGEIVRPRLHEMSVKDITITDVDSNNSDMLVLTVLDAFRAHKQKVNEYACTKNILGSKLLVTTDGLESLHTVRTNQKFIDFCKENHIDVFSFSSDEGDFFGSIKKDRIAIIDTMNKLQDSKDAIFIHYDILTEGIDIPAITGVLPLRDLPTTKLLQNVGRAARLLKTDRELLYSGVIKYNQLDKMVKPYCWVIIPSYMKSLKNGSYMTDLVKLLRDTYDIQREQIGEDDKALASVDSMPISILKPIKKGKSKVCEIEHTFENLIIHEFVGAVNESEDKRAALSDILSALKQPVKEYV